MPTKVNIPLSGRTFERNAGCWSCVHYAPTEKSLQHWKTSCRPRNDARIAEAKQAIADGAFVDPIAIARTRTDHNALCPCGSGLKYKQCHFQGDQAADKVARKIEGVENGVKILDDMEKTIVEGHQSLCLAPGSNHEFTDHRFMCEKWRGVEGASVARGTDPINPLPEDLKSKFGDGNE